MDSWNEKGGGTRTAQNWDEDAGQSTSFFPNPGSFPELLLQVLLDPWWQRRWEAEDPNSVHLATECCYVGPTVSTSLRANVRFSNGGWEKTHSSMSWNQKNYNSSSIYREVTFLENSVYIKTMQKIVFYVEIELGSGFFVFFHLHEYCEEWMRASISRNQLS